MVHLLEAGGTGTGVRLVTGETQVAAASVVAATAILAACRTDGESQLLSERQRRWEEVYFTSNYRLRLVSPCFKPSCSDKLILFICLLSGIMRIDQHRCKCVSAGQEDHFQLLSLPNF